MGKIKFFADAAEKGFPFIWISEGNLKGIILLVDTGSNDNIIFGYAYKQLKDRFVDVEGKSSLNGIGGKMEVYHTSAYITFCGKEHKMIFLVSEDNATGIQLSKEMGFPISGIIGTKFMVEHGWIIDYAHQEFIIPDVDVTVGDLKKTKNKEPILVQ